jgi:hypothetical protein
MVLKCRWDMSVRKHRIPEPTFRYEAYSDWDDQDSVSRKSMFAFFSPSLCQDCV